MDKDQTAIDESAAMLLNAWWQGQVMNHLPLRLRPDMQSEAYAIQAALARLSGEPQVGWKIAATSIAGQAHIGVNGPIAGRLLASRVFDSPARRPLGANRMRVAEAEFAFRLGQDLPARTSPYSVEEVMSAVATLQPAIELPDSRFKDFVAAGGDQLTADNACAHELVLGVPAASDWRSIDLSTHPTTLSINNQAVSAGTGADALGDPRLALTWIANNHIQQRGSLCAGHVITTGVCGSPSAITVGDEVMADFGQLGQVSIVVE